MVGAKLEAIALCVTGQPPLIRFYDNAQVKSAENAG